MSEQVASPDLLVAGIAAKQHGVVSVWQMRDAGLGRSAVTVRVRAGRLHRLHRGVYSVGHNRPSLQGCWMAAILACGGAGRHESVRAGDTRELGATVGILEYWGAALSHRAAAILWEMLPPKEEPIDVSIRGSGGRAKRTGIRLHRSLLLSPASVTLRSGIPVTTPARTIADLRRASSGGSRRITPKELRRAIRQANFLGLHIDEVDRNDRNRSDLEEEFQALCRKHGLPAPEVNVRVGPHLVDFLWRDRNLVVETDGYVAHRGRAAFEDDRGRDLDLRARDFEVIRLAEKQVAEEPQRVAEVVGAALRVGADVAWPS